MHHYGDFCGFTFNGVHSSDLAIVRVSNGSRYEDEVMPQFQDKTQVVPGRDGTYYFETNYTNRIFRINIAFDSMTEVQYRQFAQVFNGKARGELVYDERPYKAYMVKIQGSPVLQTICFMDEFGQRIYKGEGTINFVCYSVYARSIKKWLSEYNVDNLNEWKDSSGMRMIQENFDATQSTYISLYNPGDLPTDWIAYYTANAARTLKKITIREYISGPNFEDTNPPVLIFSNGFTIYNSDQYIGINSKTQLIEGYDQSFNKTGTLYNQYITSGDFFQIPVTNYDVEQQPAFQRLFCSFNNVNANTPDWDNLGVVCDHLEYFYLYY